MELKKIIRMLIVINILQIFLVISIWFFKELGDEIGLSVFLYYLCMGLVIVNSMTTLCSFYFINSLKSSSLIESINNLEALNTRLRSQRHEYLNQLQVVYGLMELEEYEEAKRYLEPFCKDIMKVSKALKTAQPAVNALLQAKIEMAEQRKIDLYIEVKSDLKQIPIEPWGLCKVLSNIVDNAITALEKKETNRNLHIEIDEDSNQYLFSIYNNGPQIPKEQLDAIFKKGFTTKKEEGHGMGLYIVADIIQKVGGNIQVFSEKDKTTFEVSIPKSGKVQ